MKIKVLFLSSILGLFLTVLVPAQNYPQHKPKGTQPSSGSSSSTGRQQVRYPAARPGREVSKQLSAELEPIVTRAMEGYNAKDWKKHFKDCVPNPTARPEQLEGIAYTMETTFSSYGKFRSRILLPESNQHGDEAFLMWNSQFEKAKDVRMKATFHKVGQVYKLQALSF